MKNNIYDFPQGERKNAFKNAVKVKKLSRIKTKSGLVIWRVLEGVSRVGLIMLATVLQLAVCLLLSILSAVRMPVLWIGAAICVVTYFHLGHHFVSSTNLTIPFIAGICTLSMLSLPLLEWMNRTSPFHRLFGQIVDSRNVSGTGESDY
jgi:hypothetical protein